MESHKCVYSHRMAIAQAKEGIEKELTCPLCLEIFTDPKRLPCDHIYCKDPCLKGLVLRSLHSTITCPECRTVAQVPNFDVSTFPTAFQINRLKELYHSMQDKDETDSPQTESPEQQKEPATCEVHRSQPIALYCETCEEALCRDCVIKSDKHKEHEYGYIKEVADKQREVITSEIEPTKQLVMQVSTALKEISQEKEKIVTQGKTHSDHIDTTFKAMITALTEEKELLKSKISLQIQRRTSAISSQEEKLATCLSELSDTIKQVETSVQSQSDLEIAGNKIKYVRQIQQQNCKFQGLSLQPTVRADLGLQLSTPSKVRSCCKEGNYTYPLADPQKCVLETFKYSVLGKPCTATIQLRDNSGKRCTYPQDIQVELKCIRDNTVIGGEVTGSGIIGLSITITPVSRGRHEVGVKVNNAHIAGSPFSVFAHILPQKLRKPVSTITDVKEPVALCCFRDKLYITSMDSGQISVLNEHWSIARTYNFEGAAEMTIDDDTEEMYVSDAYNHQLHKLDKHGTGIKSVGGRGAGPDKFDFPNGIQISRDGEVFVSDTRNHRIKVYDKELQLLRVIGEQGTKKSCFNKPCNLAFDESGNLFVTEKENVRVQVISPDGNTILMFGQSGRKAKSKPGQLKTPVGITINGQYVYIANWNYDLHSISVFTTKGDFVTTFGSDYLHRPECIAIDRDGYVYVSDNSQRIVVF